MFNTLIKRMRYGHFSREKQKAFFEDLSTLVEGGVPVSQAVETMRQVSEGITERVATHIMRCISQGKQLADGMQGWFSCPLVEIIRAGEVSGILAKTLKAAAYPFSQQTNAINSFFGTMVYPLLVVIAAACFMETLGLLISNGAVLKKSLSIMHREAAPYLSWHN